MESCGDVLATVNWPTADGEWENERWYPEYLFYAEMYADLINELNSLMSTV